MKKSILPFNALIVLLITSLLGCNDLTKNVQNTSNEENKYIGNTSQVYLEDIENFRKETSKTIDSNSQKIIAYKAKTETKLEENKYDFRQAILELELQNSYMKMKLDKYEPAGKEEWEIFKAKYTCQLIELNKEFIRFSEANLKTKQK